MIVPRIGPAVCRLTIRRSAMSRTAGADDDDMDDDAEIIASGNDSRAL